MPHGIVKKGRIYLVIDLNSGDVVAEYETLARARRQLKILDNFANSVSGSGCTYCKAMGCGCQYCGGYVGGNLGPYPYQYY